jgi:phosphatidate cytidylyltransferase
MLAKRLVTALILALLVLAAIFYLPSNGFLLATTLAALWAAWEWCCLMAWERVGQRAIYLLLSFVLLWLAYHCPLRVILLLSLLWWIVAVLLVISYPRSAVIWARKPLIIGVMGLLILVPAWVAVNIIRQADSGAWNLLYLLILVSVADSAAYFSGRRFGRHRLLVEVSPGKTWEGVVGAVIAILVTTLLLARFFDINSIWRAILLSLLVLIATIIGDLTESMFKRARGVKDSGCLLPGHGGILDRIDGLLAAAPVFLLLSLLLR